MEGTGSRLTRRNLLGGFAAAGVIAALAVAIKNPAGVQGAGSRIREAFDGRPRRPSLATAESAQWQEAVGSDFAIGHTRMRLAGVRPLPKTGPRPSTVRQNPFIAVFELPLGQTLPGNLTYSVRTARSSAFNIFLSESSEARRLLAVFN